MFALQSFLKFQFNPIYFPEHKYTIFGSIYQPATGPLADTKKFIAVVLLGDFYIDLIKYNKNYGVDAN